MVETAEEKRLALEIKTTLRRMLDKFAKTIGTCDGEDAEALRAWLRGIDHAATGSKADAAMVVEMAVYLSGGDLGEFILTHTKNIEEKDLKWNTVREAIVSMFLSADEMDYLQDKVYRMRQAMDQSAWEYGRKFKAACIKAFPTDEYKSEFVQKTLARCFTQSLRDPKVRQEVFADKSVKLDEVVKKATEVAHSVYKSDLCDTLFTEKTAEVAEVQSSSSPKKRDSGKKEVSPDKIQKMLEHLCLDVAHLKQSTVPMAAISSSTGPQSANLPGLGKKKRKKGGAQEPQATQTTAPARQIQGGPLPGSNDRGTIGNLPFAPPRNMCWQCGEIGHVVRDCPLKNSAVVAAVEAAVHGGNGEISGVGYANNQGN